MNTQLENFPAEVYTIIDINSTYVKKHYMEKINLLKKFKFFRIMHFSHACKNQWKYMLVATATA